MKFQFQYGAIESPDEAIDEAYENNFNSSMVRLKEAETKTLNITGTLFQFQYGAIERG